MPTSSDYRLTCIAWRPLKKNTLMGFAEFALPGLGVTIRDCPIHEKNSSRWMAFPARLYHDEAGSPQYVALLTFTDAPAKALFQEKALKALDDYQHSQGR